MNKAKAMRTPDRKISRILPMFMSRGIFFTILVLGGLPGLIGVAGCESEDCVNCVDSLPPVVPTGVHSISGDGEVVIQWYDISYHPYDGEFNPNVERYFIYWRHFQEGDQDNPNRTFEYLGEVAWDENFDDSSGLHWFVDGEAVNENRYEYAVSAVNAAGLESALSYELVTDAPLPHAQEFVWLYDRNGQYPERSTFDFSLTDNGHNSGFSGFQADIQVFWENDIPYAESIRSGVFIQDFGVFANNAGDLVFEGVSWAPDSGYSNSGVVELIENHIYVLRLDDYPDGIHYAKLGVRNIGNESMPQENMVLIDWAYQLIPGLNQLSVPSDDVIEEVQPQIVSY